MSLTPQEILDQLAEKGVPEDERREAATQEMKDIIQTKMKLQGPPPPQLIATVNTDHIMALFRLLIEWIHAGEPEEVVQAALEEFVGYRDFDITTRHYLAYLRMEDDK